MLALGIIAGNVWTSDEGRRLTDEGPFFSSGRLPETRVVFANDLIPAGEYYYHVPGYSKDNPYPIVPNFNAWIYPKDTPKPWEALRIRHTPPIATRRRNPSTATPSTSTPNTTIPSADNSPPYSDGFVPPVLQALSSYDGNRSPCPVTFDLTAIQKGYVVPKTARNWMAINNMWRFKPKDGVVDHSCNTIFLRHDVHDLWNDNYVVMIPKPDLTHPGQYRLGTHVWNLPNKSEDADMQIFAFYQNRPCYPIPHVPVEFFFARFAWAIFTHYTINLLDSDIDDNEYAVYDVIVNDDGSRSYKAKRDFGRDLSKLSAQATGGKGLQRDVSHVIEADPSPSKRRQVLYSYHTGEMGWESDGHGGFSEYDSDGTDHSSDSDYKVKSKHSSLQIPPELSGSVMSLTSDKSSNHGYHGPQTSSLPLGAPAKKKPSHDHLVVHAEGHVHFGSGH
ncbi:hypothetical protein GGR52DRAFT_559987 [Hypoxylon sp. FL1284]|nr:hypothetical protein GGR52DRAFT_559987 [Hypoxylon sp. FL1284]